jgi:glycine cleavage system H protein
MRPSDRKYLPTHEWCKVQQGIATIGITDYAVSHLSDLVFLDLPPKGRKVTAGKPFAEIESVKAVSEIYSPVSGEIVAVNEALPDDLPLLAQDPWDKGWMVKVKLAEASSELLDAAAYEKHVAAQPD